jgi:large conductance mechanosensitive channel
MTEREPLERLEQLVKTGVRTGTRRLDLAGFREFILRGNVVDLAVGIVIGAAFTSVVKALVADFITPIVAIPLGRSGNFGDRFWGVGGSKFLYGDFLNNMISFVLVGLVVYYFVVKPVNRLMDRYKTATDSSVVTQTCPECKSSIPVDATRCAFCTVVLPTAAVLPSDGHSA